MSPIVEQLLAQRGIEDKEAFFNPVLARLAKPEELPGIVSAAEVIIAAVVEHRKIVIFGDYDCDGVCATAIMIKTLEALGTVAEPFLPRRLSEGYGMTEQSVARMLKEFPDVGLVITVDNGINSVEEVAALKAKGIEVVITDHHLPGEELPPATAIVNPKVEAPEHLRNICGAVVALMLANRMVTVARQRGLYSGAPIGGPLVVLAGLATVTDIMPILGQNRIVVAEALAHFNSWAPIGLRELYSRVVRTMPERMTSRDFSFMLGPRINAAGRMSSGIEALELVLTTDQDIARGGAYTVDNFNLERKAVEGAMTEEALKQVVEGAPAQVINLPDGHPGVAGIVAARVLERLNVPVCVLAGGHGSGRVPNGFNLRDAFIACAEVLDRFGGHAAAGGFSVKEGRVDEFRERLCQYAKPLMAAIEAKGKDNEPDLWLTREDVNLALAEDVQQMEPFGEGNREPIFGFRDAIITDVKPLGSEGKHLVATVNGLKSIWWGKGDMVEKLRQILGKPQAMTFKIEISDYGERHIELRIINLL